MAQIRALSAEYAKGNQPAPKREKQSRMKPCAICSKRSWSYDAETVTDGARKITATCGGCGHVVSWAKKSKPMTPERARSLAEKEKPVSTWDRYIPWIPEGGWAAREGKLPWQS
ncbi:MAG: hypothetical protein LLG20_18595 [Acidobacteriales bacterium]|nr:hypothetical protein [Terriglobales bacterium]